jgi:adenylate cyclase
LLSLLYSQSPYFETGAVNEWEGYAQNVRFHRRGSLPSHPEVVIVGVTSSSFDQTLLAQFSGESEAIRLMAEHPVWPWPRSIHALVIDRLLAAGARVVAVDFVFAARTAEDDALAATLRKYPGRVVLAASVQYQRGENDAATNALQYPNPELMAAVGPDSTGFVTYSDSGSSIRRRFDFRTSEVNIHPRLADYMDDPRDLWTFAPLAVHKYIRHPLPTDYQVLINYSGPVNTFTPLPVENLFIPKTWNDDPHYRKGEAFRNKIVFYGPVAELFHDIIRTPFGDMPGVEVHANVAANLLRGDVLRDATLMERSLLAAICIILTALSALWFRSPLFQSSGALAVAFVFCTVTQITFAKGTIFFPTIPTVFAIAVTGAISITYLFILEKWERAHTRKVLDRTINKRIAKVMLHNAEFEQARRGERRAVTILFSDIRSFTTWSESAEPENLVGQLNEYFEKMVALIEGDDSLGNAQKFIGDAILAAWGDTPENRFGDAEDVRRAVTTALHMRKALEELNADWKEREGRLVISTGIGINHGDVVVGEVGHPDRGEYTVLGDGVNFAARLESATKQFHTDILVGESVEALTREKFVFRHVDFVRVKGKTRPVNIYIPLSDRTVPPPEWLADYHRARALYAERKFAEAGELFRATKARMGGEDFLCEMYLERCALYAQESPEGEWDGSYTMTEK